MTALPTVAQFAASLDHALLKPTLTEAELRAGCAEAARLAVASVCIVPDALPLAVQALAGTGVQPSTTVGFPHGVQTARCKLREAEEALTSGATELDAVVNVGRVLGGDWPAVRAELRDLLAAVREHGARLKVIFENAYLGDAQKRALCEVCSELGVDWVKTSTGFGPSGATEADVALMRRCCPPHVAVKASGGIRTLDQALALLALGANRLGTSGSANLIEALRQRWDAAGAHRAQPSSPTRP